LLLTGIVLRLVGVVMILPALPMGDAGAAVSEKAVELLRHPLKVTAAAGDNESPGLFSLEMRVDNGVDSFRFTAIVRANSFDRAVETQRGLTRWKEPFLLVGYDRGGKNSSRDRLDLVFALRRGRLLYLGEVEANSFKGGVFRDTYEKFEENGLTSRAGAPTFPLILEEKGGRLRVNLERTWRESQGRFRENRAELRGLLRRKVLLSGPTLIDFTESVLFNAVLSKYCRRQTDLQEALKAAAAGLDREDSKLFTDMVSDVIPGEFPRAAVEVTSEKK
jgi:hypothetical protein